MTAKYRQKVFDKRSARGGAKPFQIVLMAIATYFGQVLLAAFFYQNMEDMRFINAFYMVCRRLSPPFPPSPPFHPALQPTTGHIPGRSGRAGKMGEEGAERGAFARHCSRRRCAHAHAVADTAPVAGHGPP